MIRDLSLLGSMFSAWGVTGCYYPIGCNLQSKEQFYKHVTVTFGVTVLFLRAVTQKRCVIVKEMAYYNSVIRLQTGNQHNLVLQPRDSMDKHI